MIGEPSGDRGLIQACCCTTSAEARCDERALVTSCTRRTHNEIAKMVPKVGVTCIAGQLQQLSGNLTSSTYTQMKALTQHSRRKICCDNIYGGTWQSQKLLSNIWRGRGDPLKQNDRKATCTRNTSNVLTQDSKQHVQR